MNLYVHDGVFHADDLLAAALIGRFFPIDRVIRTRDLSSVKEGDWVADVGGGEFDHHSLPKEAYPNGVEYAACGKVARYLQRIGVLSASVLDELCRRLLWPVEASDNGQKAADFGLGPNKMSWSHAFNGNWDETTGQDDRFQEALKITKAILDRELAAIAAVTSAQGLLDSIADSDVVVLPQYVPWQEYAVANWPKAKLVLYPAQGEWRAQVVPCTATPGDFSSRVQFPAAWAGLRNEKLSEVTGIAGARFCHAGRFLTVWATREDALAGAALALREGGV